MDSRDAFPLSPRDIWLRRQLIADGWTDYGIARAVAAGDLGKIRHGAYTDGSIWRSLDEVGQHRGRARAVLRTGHPTSVLTHQSSVTEWGIPSWRLELDDVAVTRTDGRPGRNEAGIVHHVGALPPEQVTLRHEVPVSTAARAAVETLSVVDLEVGFVVLCGLLHQGHTTLEEVRAVAAGTDHWPHSLSIRMALSRADERLSSVAEARFQFLCFRQHLPTPEPQVRVCDEQGELVGIVDFLWREHGVFLEFDGRIKYERHRRPDETVEEYVLREKRREERICALTGWVCLRITWADLEHPVRTAGRIAALLASRRRPVA